MIGYYIKLKKLAKNIIYFNKNNKKVIIIF